MSRSVVDKLGVKNGLKVCVVGGGDYLLPKLLKGVGEEGSLLHFEEWQAFVREVSGLGDVDVVLFGLGRRVVWSCSLGKCVRF